MGKKNLVILLLVPFIIAILSAGVITGALNLVERDIIGIGWEYNQAIAVKKDQQILLKAYGISDKNYPVTDVKLVWSIKDDGTSSMKIAEIVDNKYLKGINDGRTTLHCSNESGTIGKNIEVVVYSTSAIVISPKIKSSKANIDSNIYYGQYDFDENYKKVGASFEFEIETYGSNTSDDVKLLKIESLVDSAYEDEENVSVNMNTRVISISNNIFLTDKDSDRLNKKQSLKQIEVKITFGFDASDIDNKTANETKFIVVKDGINVYDYNQLLESTNRSDSGEIVVLRKSFESLSFYTDHYDTNVELFGNYVDGKYSFKDEVYRFTTNYNHEFIKQWNELASKNKNISETTDQVLVGLHVQKDFYGNGYTVNLHNLTYPSKTQEIDGGTITPELGENDLFRGPLPFYLLGNPNDMKNALVGAYGQDNIGMYVEGDNITVNDVNLKNCDLGNALQNLEYVGTVLETYGDNIVIENSILSNGKNVVKTMSSTVDIKNCLIQNSRNFLLTSGSYKYAEVDDKKENTFYDKDGNLRKSSLKDYLFFNERTSTNFDSFDSYGDELLNRYMLGWYKDQKIAMENGIDSVQSALDNNITTLPNDGTTNIIDTLFYQSGISCIGLETLFNGPFLYNSAPSFVSYIFSAFGEAINAPLLAKGVGGISYPVTVNIKGSTKFYDYKKVDEIDLSGLILEHITSIFSEFLGDTKVTIEKIFPLIPLLRSAISFDGGFKIVDGVSYTNIIAAYYGGGLNLSKINFSSDSEYYRSDMRTKQLELKFLDEYLQDSYTSEEGSLNLNRSLLKTVLLKCVTIVTGFNPFKLICGKKGYLFNMKPQVTELKDNYSKGS